MVVRVGDGGGDKQIGTEGTGLKFIDIFVIVKVY